MADTPLEPRFSPEPLTVALAVLAALAVSVFAFALPAWSFSLALCLLLCLVLIPTLRLGMPVKLAFFFGLLALADFLKRLIFLAPFRDPWAQYLVYLLPHVYYLLAVFIPWLASRRRLSIFQLGVFLFVVVAVLNTWANANFGLVVKLAATGLLILPWTAVALAADQPWRSLLTLGYAIVPIGLLSACYGALQFVFGPTLIETRWAQAVGGISIGARALDIIQKRIFTGPDVWRIMGLQADALTFALFLIVAVAFALVLYLHDRISKRGAAVIVLVLSLGVGLSIVRTMWVALAVSTIFGLLAQRFPVLMRGWVFLLAATGMFVGAAIVSGWLVQLKYLQLLYDSPLLSRVLTFGTLSARADALNGFLAALPHRWLTGLGYGVSEWFVGKLTSSTGLPANYASHNLLVGMLYTVGLPGLLIFLAMLAYGFSRAASIARDRSLRPGTRRTAVVLAACIFGLFLGGMANGSSAINYYFFFLLGILGGGMTESDST